MKSSWQTDTGNLSCRWSEVGQRVQYDSAWIQEMSVVQSGYLPPVPDFASHSPLGSGEWFVPWRLRWNVPDGRPPSEVAFGSIRQVPPNGIIGNSLGPEAAWTSNRFRLSFVERFLRLGRRSTRRLAESGTRMIDRRPAAIARCSGPADVRAAVRFAVDQDIYPAIRGGGHNAAGLAMVDDGLVDRPVAHERHLRRSRKLDGDRADGTHLG